MTSNKTAWGYVRLSQESDTSIDKQKASIREYAREHDLHLQTTRNDGNRTSGFNDEREEYQLLRQKIDAGAIDAVITRDRARLSRDFDERLRLLVAFRDAGVAWHVVEAGGDLHLERDENAMMEAIHAGMDHIKKQAEIERAREAMSDRMESGYDHGRPRFGMVYDDNKQYQIPDGGEDWETVKRIWALREGGESYGTIAQQVGQSKSVVRAVCENRAWYEERAGMAEVEG